MESVFFNIIACIFFTATCILILIRKNNSKFVVSELMPLFFCILLYIGVSASNILEHAEITSVLDPVEDIAEIAFVILFLFFAYNCRVHVIIEELHEQKLWLSQTLHSIADGVIATDKSGKILTINAAMEELTGWSEDQALMQDCQNLLNFSDKNTGKPVEYNPFDYILHLHKDCEITYDSILITNCVDNHTTPVTLNASPINIDGNKRIGAICIFRNMSNYDSMLEQLTHMHKMEALGQLASGVAHDINNMLGGIIGAADLLNCKFNPEEREKYSEVLKVLFDASERAADLTSNLLAFSRKGRVLSTPVSLNDILANTLSLVRNTIRNNLSIVTNMSPIDLTVIGDPTQLQNAFLNLILNANDAMPDGGTLTIKLDTVSLSENWCINCQFNIDSGEYAYISFIDHGCGIPGDVQKKIFEPFYTTKELGKGTGLGLSAVYGSIVNHHGAIIISSNIGEGTCFEIYLPLSTKALKKETITDHINPVQHDTLILVIEDEKIIQSTVSMILKEFGYSVIVASDGLTGLELFKDNRDRISVVLLDMIMPGISGNEVLDEILNVDPGAKVILTSGFSQKKVSPRFAGFIQKPYRKEVLSAKISSVISNNSST